MTYELIRGVWFLYFAVIAVLFLNSVSMLVFAPTIQKAKDTIVSFAFLPFWPLAIFSPEGRKILTNKIERI